MTNNRTVTPRFGHSTTGCIVVRRADATAICRTVDGRSPVWQGRNAGRETQ